MSAPKYLRTIQFEQVPISNEEIQKHLRQWKWRQVRGTWYYVIFIGELKLLGYFQAAERRIHFRKAYECCSEALRYETNDEAFH